MNLVVCRQLLQKLINWLDELLIILVRLSICKKIFIILNKSILLYIKTYINSTKVKVEAKIKTFAGLKARMPLFRPLSLSNLLFDIGKKAQSQ